MRRIWAVARTTFLECLRTRVVLAVTIALAAALPTIALTMEGDGTLKGRIQTFLAYSVSVTQVLLGVMVVLLATGTVAQDLRRKSVFLVATKPLPRSHYVLGRWAGIVALSAALLAAAMAATAGLARHLRRLPTAHERQKAANPLLPAKVDLDRLAVENDVFAARARHAPDPIDVDRLVQEEFEARLLEAGRDNIIREHVRAKIAREMARAGRAKDPVDDAEVVRRAGDPAEQQAALDELRQELRTRQREELLLVPAGRMWPLRLSFSGIRLPEAARQTVQLRYRLYPLVTPDSKRVYTTWRLYSPKYGYRFVQPLGRSDPTEMHTSVTVPAEMVSEEGTFVAEYFNDRLSETPVKLKLEEIALYYRVGSLEGNLLRASGLMLLRVMFLTAVGVLFGACWSFPIACLACMFVLIVGVMSGFITEATKVPTYGGANVGLYTYFSHYLARGVYLFLPGFAGSSPVDPLVDGAQIALGAIGREVLTGTGVRTAAALLIGSLIFWRRELAKVQI